MVDIVTISKSLAVGAVGEVPLERFGTGGYVWTIEPVASDFAETRIVPRATGDLQSPGGPTLETLEVRVNRSGTYEIVLNLRRPWEREAIKTLKILLDVR